MAGELPDLDRECFFIAPIGADDTEERKRSNGVLDYVVAPAAAKVGLEAIRADRIAKPGQITLQVIEHVLRARAAVADLTGMNPNVYYELAVRHTAKLPVVLIAEEGERLPFDIAQMRTIFLNHKDLASAAQCMDQIALQLEEALKGAVDSPIATSVNLQHLEQGSDAEKTLADLVTGMEGLTRDLSDVQSLLYRTMETAGTTGGRLSGDQREGVLRIQRRIWELARRELREELMDEITDYLVALDRLMDGEDPDFVLYELERRRRPAPEPETDDAKENHEPSSSQEKQPAKRASESQRRRSGSANRTR